MFSFESTNDIALKKHIISLLENSTSTKPSTANQRESISQFIAIVALGFDLCTLSQSKVLRGVYRNHHVRLPIFIVSKTPLKQMK